MQLGNQRFTMIDTPCYLGLADAANRQCRLLSTCSNPARLDFDHLSPTRNTVDGLETVYDYRNHPR